MTKASRRSRRQLAQSEAEETAHELRDGRRHRLADVVFPADVPVDLRVLRDVDFENCKVWLNIHGGRIRRGQVEGCRFVDVDLEALRVWKSDIRSVDFERVTIGEQNMGGIHDSTITDVAFRGSRLVDYNITRTRLRDVSFTGGDLDGLRVRSSHLARVDIASQIKDALFIDCDFTQTNISGSEAQDVTFMDWHTADVRLPEGRSGFFVTSEDLEFLVRPILPELSVPVRDRFMARVLGANVSPVAMSDSFLRSEVGASPGEAGLVIDALFPKRIRSLSDIEAN